MKRVLGTIAVLALAAVWAAPALAQEEAKPPAVSHDVQGREQCMMCHTPGAMEAVPDAPANHEGRDVAVCLWCHAADSPMLTATPKATPHDVAGREQCMMCHKAGAMEAIPDAPADHEGRDVTYCTMCHTAGGM
jgi:hypothetical protein